MHYSDKRARYSNAAPWDFIPGTANAANKTKIEAKTSSMARVSDTYEQNEKGEHVLVAGNKSARDTFRVTTARQSEIPDNGNVEKPLTNQFISGTIDGVGQQSNPNN